MRLAAVALILGSISVGCTGSVDRETPDPAALPSAAGSPSPSSALDSDIRFLLDETYSPGDRIVVKIKNLGSVAYRYQLFYQACFLSYFDSTGRKFIIPTGTHCDIRSWAPIRPGQVKRLFRWHLDECIKDAWGCAKSRPLAQGMYTIQGVFRPADPGSGSPARAGVTFEIQAFG